MSLAVSAVFRIPFCRLGITLVLFRFPLSVWPFRPTPRFENRVFRFGVSMLRRQHPERGGGTRRQHPERVGGARPRAGRRPLGLPRLSGQAFPRSQEEWLFLVDGLFGAGLLIYNIL